MNVNARKVEKQFKMFLEEKIIIFNQMYTILPKKINKNISTDLR